MIDLIQLMRINCNINTDKATPDQRCEGNLIVIGCRPYTDFLKHGFKLIWKCTHCGRIVDGNTEVKYGRGDDSL